MNYFNPSDTKGLQLTLRMGYHTGFKPEQDNGFTGGIIYDVNACSEISNGIYAGFGFDFICAAISHWVVDGFGGQAIFPVIALAILSISYIFYHKMKSAIETGAYPRNFAV